MYTLLYVKRIVGLPKWSGREHWEWRQNTKSGATGQGTCNLYWTEVQSPLWVQVLFLIADYKTFLVLSFPRLYADIVQILFSPQAILFWANLGNNQQVHRQHSCLMQSSVPRSILSWAQSYFLLGLALEFVTRLFLRKTWKIIINRDS